MKSRGMMLAVAIAIGLNSVTFAGTAEDRIAELEQRIEALEKAVYGNTNSKKAPMPSKASEAKTDDDGISISGICIVGEDIAPGSYRFEVTEGTMGSLTVFSDYDSYIETSGNQFMAVYYEDLRSPNYESTGEFEDWNDYINAYLTSVENVNLKDGMCVAVEGVKVKAYKK